jgi:hypothetical protein
LFARRECHALVSDRTRATLIACISRLNPPVVDTEVHHSFGTRKFVTAETEYDHLACRGKNGAADDFLRLPFDEFREYGKTSIQVIRRMIALDNDLIAFLPEERLTVLVHQRDRLAPSSPALIQTPKQKSRRRWKTGRVWVYSFGRQPRSLEHRSVMERGDGSAKGLPFGVK